MIFDRLILFFFGRGPQAEKEKEVLAAAQARGASARGASARGASKGLAARFKNRVKTKTKTKKKKANKKQAVKKATKKSNVKKKATASKTRIKKASPKKALKKATAQKKIAKKIAKKATKKTTKLKKRKSGVHRDIHVVFRTEEKLWGVIREGSRRADSLYLHQEDAIKAARSRARHEEVELIVHRKDGTIRSSWTSR